MASNPTQPLNSYFEKDIVRGSRSNFNVGYKNRFSADFCYLYPVGLWDIPADSHFECDITSVLSSNPTLAPVLGKVKFRAEAYFVEKAAYVNSLRNNSRIPIDRNVGFPYFDARFNEKEFSPRGSIFDYLQMYPAGWHAKYIQGDDNNDATPRLNAIPFLMYYDIYRNYYANPQDDNIPIRTHSYVSPDDDTYYPIEDKYVTRQDFDNFVITVRNGELDASRSFEFNFGFNPFPETNSPNMIISDFDHRRYTHRCLLRRTLNNDFFTSFMSNANVYDMSRYSTIQAGSTITMEQIALANRNWRIATRSLLWGNDWKNYNKVHYGVDLLIPYGKPQFLGAISSDVVFNDVISQSQNGNNDSNSITSNQNLASRAGLAFGSLKNGDKKFIEFNTKDEGFVMVLISLTPEVDYFQGIDPMYFKTNLQHSWMHELNSVGMQDFHRAWASVVPVDYSSSVTMPFQSLNTAIWKVPIWFEYMAKYNQLHGDFTADNIYRYWVFSRPFDGVTYMFPDGVVSDPTDQDSADDFFGSTYGMPEMFNYIFANSLGQDNFQVQVRFDARLNNMLDKQPIAYL